MAIDPFWGILLSSLTSGVGAAMQGNPYQQRLPYSGTSAAQPQMDALLKSLNGMGGGLSERLQNPVGLRTVAHGLPGQNQDPAIADPSILKRPGLDMSGLFGKSAPTTPITAPSDPTSPDRLGVRQKKVAPGTDPAGSGSGGDASGMHTGASVNNWGDFFRMLQSPLLYTPKKKPTPDPNSGDK